MAEIWKGAPVAAALTEELAARCEKLKASGVTPTLAIVRVGERPDDVSYETGATKRCAKVGVAVKQFLIAVDGFKNNPHELGKYLALFFGVMVFILCGFEHCVANMYYFSIAGMWNGKALLWLLVMTAGNAVGGVIFPLAQKLNHKT